MSNLIDVASVPVIDVWGESVRARRIEGERVTLALVELAPDSIVPGHRHDNEQLGMVITGSVTFTVGDETRELGPGGTWRIPSDTPHQVSVGPGRGGRHRRLRADPWRLGRAPEPATEPAGLAEPATDRSVESGRPVRRTPGGRARPGRDGIGRFRGDRQGEPDRGATAVARSRPDPAAERIHDALAERQADAEPVGRAPSRLGPEERFEQAGGVDVVEAQPSVEHLDHDLVAGRPRCRPRSGEPAGLYLAALLRRFSRSSVM